MALGDTNVCTGPNNTGKSIFGIILFHAIANTGRSVFPGGRSYFELAGGAVGYSIIAITAVIVAFLWGSKTLARYRFGKAVFKSDYDRNIVRSHR